MMDYSNIMSYNIIMYEFKIYRELAYIILMEY